MKYCEQCGTPMHDDERFCTKCGAEWKAAGSNQAPAAQGAPAASKAKNVIIAAATAAVVFGVGTALILGQKPNTTPSSAEQPVATSQQQDSTNAEEAAKQKAEEEAAAKKKAEEEAAQKAVQAKRDAYNAVLDGAGSGFVEYALAEMSGDDIPELILKPDTSQRMSYNNYPVYTFSSGASAATKAGDMSLHLFRGHLADDKANHVVYWLESHGDDYYWSIARVQGGTLQLDHDNGGTFHGKAEMEAAGVEELTWISISDRSVIDAL